MADTKRAPDRDLIAAGHAFPGEYVIKAFGPGADAFTDAVGQGAQAVVGERAAVSMRTSSKGNHVCVTVTVQAENVDEVIAVYERLHEVPDLLLIL